MKDILRHSIEYSIASVDDMNALAEHLATILQYGDVLALTGDLGAGKTTLAQAIGRSLGVTQVMSSPTYAIVHHYDTAKGTLVHADLYRLQSLDELEMTGFADDMNRQTLVVVEWADKFRDWLNALSPTAIWVSIAYDGMGRRVAINGPAVLIDTLEDSYAIGH